MDRQQQYNQANITIPIEFLDESFYSLFAKAMDFASKIPFKFGNGKSVFLSDLYRNQPIVILSEVQYFDIKSSEQEFQSLCSNIVLNKPKIINAISLLINKIENWRTRLQFASLHDNRSYLLLDDIHSQISMTLKKYYRVFALLYLPESDTLKSSCWIDKSLDIVDSSNDDFLYHFISVILSALRLFQSKADIYWKEMLATGVVEPSFAMMIVFLQNYVAMSANFNKRWLDIPYLYVADILRANLNSAKYGSLWLQLNKIPAINNVYLPKNTNIVVDDENFHLLSDCNVSNAKIENISLIEICYDKNRFPEADLGLASSIKLHKISGDNADFCADLGICFYSDVLLLREGHRVITINWELEPQSIFYFVRLVKRVSRITNITENEVLAKILNENTFRIQVTTENGWCEITNCAFRFIPVSDVSEQHCDFFRKLYENVYLYIDVDSTFPAIQPILETDKVGLRILISHNVWLFPYSWCCQIRLKKIDINVEVEGLKNLAIYNEVGLVDINQVFAPFGIKANRGAWFAVGSYEMSRKNISSVELSFDWHNLPDNSSGLAGYYEDYEAGITNESFLIRAEYLFNNEWRSAFDLQRLFLSKREKGELSHDDSLSENSKFILSIPSSGNLNYHSEENFRIEEVNCGFYRFVLTNPEFGFGEDVYRRIFAETMILNAHRRNPKPQPNSPIAPTIDKLRLNYKASAQTVFSLGGEKEIDVKYVRPNLGRNEIFVDCNKYLPFILGGSDEARLYFALSGFKGQNEVSLYFDMNELLRDIDDVDLPVGEWRYNSGNGWKNLNSSYILRDDIKCLTKKGCVIISFPTPISSDCLDKNGLFWLSLVVKKNFKNCAQILNIYTNVVQVERVESSEFSNMPWGIASCTKLSKLENNREAENNINRRLRISERISHRNRAILASDYEKIVLRDFPEIDNVKCLAGFDPKGRNRRCVTLVIMRNPKFVGELPKCTNVLMTKVEKHLSKFVSPFILIDAINPEYEEITLFCAITIRPGFPSGEIINRIEKRLRSCIAPWQTDMSAPQLKYSFSTMDIRYAIKNCDGVLAIKGLKLIHIISRNSENDSFERRVYNLIDEGDTLISPSNAWSILVPASKQRIDIVDDNSNWQSNVGIGDFEIGNTFVIE